METNNYQYEEYINLKDLVFFVLRKWRLLLLLTVVFALICGGYKGIKTTNFGQGKEVEPNRDEVLAEEEPETVDQLLALENVVENLKYRVDYQKNYNKESLLMTMDPENVQVLKLSYRINKDIPENVYSIIDPADSILYTYTSKMQGEMFSYIGENLTPNVEPKYLMEIITLGTNFDANSLLIEVRTTDMEHAETIMKLVREYLDSVAEFMQGEYGGFAFNEIGQFDYIASDSSLANSQTTNIQSLASLQTQLETKDKELDDMYKKLGIEIPDEEDEEEKNQPSTMDIVKGVIKYVIVGAVLGFLLAGFIAVVKFLLNKTVRNEEELQNRFGIKLLGSYHVEQKRTKNGPIDRLLDRLEGIRTEVDEKSMSEMIAANVRVLVHKGGKTRNRILIAGTVDEADLQAVKGRLEKSLKKDEIQFDTGACISSNPATIEKLDANDCVLMVEKVGHSQVKEVEKEVIAALSAGKEVIGAIVL